MPYRYPALIGLLACLAGCSPGAAIDVLEDRGDLIVTARSDAWFFDEGPKCIKSVSLAFSLGGNKGMQDLGSVDFAPSKSDAEQCETRVRASKKALLAGHRPLASRTYVVHVYGKIFRGSGEIAGASLD